MVMRVSEGESAFNSEMQNEPINPDDCLFMEEWLDYYNEAEVDFRYAYKPWLMLSKSTPASAVLSSTLTGEASVPARSTGMPSTDVASAKA